MNGVGPTGEEDPVTVNRVGFGMDGSVLSVTVALFFYINILRTILPSLTPWHADEPATYPREPCVYLLNVKTLGHKLKVWTRGRVLTVTSVGWNGNLVANFELQSERSSWGGGGESTSKHNNNLPLYLLTQYWISHLQQTFPSEGKGLGCLETTPGWHVVCLVVT